MYFFEQCLSPSKLHHINQKKNAIPCSERHQSCLTEDHKFKAKISLKKKAIEDKIIFSSKFQTTQKKYPQSLFPRLQYFQMNKLISHQIKTVNQSISPCHKTHQINFIYHSSEKNFNEPEDTSLNQQFQNDEEQPRGIQVLNGEQLKSSHSQITRGTRRSYFQPGINHIDSRKKKFLEDLNFKKAESNQIHGSSEPEISDVQEQFDTSNFIGSFMAIRKQSQELSNVKTK